jgi:hypothetical protein
MLRRCCLKGLTYHPDNACDAGNFTDDIYPESFGATITHYRMPLNTPPAKWLIVHDKHELWVCPGKYQGSNFRRASHRRVLTGVYLTGVCVRAHAIGIYLTGLHLTGMHLISVHRIGMYPIGAYLVSVDVTGIYFKGVHLLIGVHLMAGIL